MTILGSSPVGVTPVTALRAAPAPHRLLMEDTTIQWDIPGMMIVIPGQLFFERELIIPWSIPDFSMGQTNKLTADVDVTSPQILWDTVVPWHIEQTHTLKVPDLQIPWDVVMDGPLRSTHPLTMDDLEIGHDVPDMAIGQISLMRVEDVTIQWEIDLGAINVTRILSVDDINIQWAIPEILMFLPTQCLSPSSRVEQLDGVRQLAETSGMPIQKSWWTKPVFRLSLVWESVDEETMRAIEGYAAAYRYLIKTFNSPIDGFVYQTIIEVMPTIRPVKSSGYYEVSMTLVGTRIGFP